ncbi:MAG: UDP-N-acetylmuramoyl-tripeptide--D-alanyl-D-alanine ligase [Bacillota bacterium]|nr:UDP-N-acetylmuramoyl-tripeptide--D-alanyl-D-alanine ligase [Bacillota bacterium]
MIFLCAIIILLICGLILRYIEETREFQQLGYYMGQYARHSKITSLHGDHVFFYGSLIAACFASDVSFVISDIGLYVSLAFAAVHLLFQILIYRGLKPKHPLAYTMRIKRLLATVTVLILLASFGILYGTVGYFGLLFIWIFMGFAFLFAPLMLLLANIVNRPMERAINNRYYREAKQCVENAPFLKIAAITGSFGKTSIKNILGDMLKYDFNTVVPPSSFNTKLGLTKVIRAELIPTTQVFIAEMGAKKIGEISETTQMLTPDVSLITTVVGQHLETFGSIENIIREKSEVYRALKPGSTAIINYDDRKMMQVAVPEGVHKLYISTKATPYAPSMYVEEVHVGGSGSRFVIVDNRDAEHVVRIPVKTSLLGEHNIFNILASAAMALTLGAKVTSIVTAAENLVPVKNRLSTRVERGITILEDAFNSNPVGAKAALDVLSLMDTDKRVIITPGMIELGDDEKEIHMEFGKQIAQVCDEVVLVTKKRTIHIYEGLKNSGYDMSKVTIVSGMRDALKMIHRICKAGDTVLIENDLPDVFEEVA